MKQENKKNLKLFQTPKIRNLQVETLSMLLGNMSYLYSQITPGSGLFL
jgi:hypothetical protein